MIQVKRKCNTSEWLFRELRTAEQLLNQAQAVADVCRTLEVSSFTYHCWQLPYSGIPATEPQVGEGFSEGVAMAG